MKQLLQNLGNGESTLVEIPSPSCGRHQVLIATQASVVSIGTEKMLVEFGKASLLAKARQQPDRVKDVLNKIKTDGLATTIEAVKNKLDQPIPLGYCNAGVVLEVGSDVRGFRPGDRVVSNGSHAEVVAVPENLVAKIPDGVEFEDAAFTVAGAIALQGVRLLNPTLGETVVVIGLGLMGLLASQILIANGCRVLGTDFDAAKCDMAASFGVTAVCLAGGADPVSSAQEFSRGRGVDGVLITASTPSNEVMHQAAQMCRQRGRVVLTGVVGLDLRRDDFYKKELSFSVSCSYGPGRYDEAYEDRGLDYPIGFVRWTSQRNFEAFLDLLASEKVRLKPMISLRVPFDDVLSVYKEFNPKNLGVVLQYPEAATRTDLRSRSVTISSTPPGATKAAIAFIGAGGFTSSTLLPALKPTGAILQSIVSNSGISAKHLAGKFGFQSIKTDVDLVFSDSQVNTIFITTRHDSHAKYVIRALEAGKRVFVEKPLALDEEELARVVEVYEKQSNPYVMVGFNRRFSPYVTAIKKALTREARPKSMIMTVNAGFIPADHWTQNPTTGGGRIIGEGCHFIDLLRFLAGSSITAVKATANRDQSGNAVEDEVTIQLEFADGSTGTILYLANGSKTFAKERLEVFCGGKILQLDNFRALHSFGWSQVAAMKTRRIEKGHAEEMAAVVTSIETGRPAPIPFDEIVEVTKATFDAVRQIRGI